MGAYKWVPTDFTSRLEASLIRAVSFLEEYLIHGALYKPFPPVINIFLQLSSDHIDHDELSCWSFRTLRQDSS